MTKRKVDSGSKPMLLIMPGSFGQLAESYIPFLLELEGSFDVRVLRHPEKAIKLWATSKLRAEQNIRNSEDFVRFSMEGKKKDYFLLGTSFGCRIISDMYARNVETNRNDGRGIFSEVGKPQGCIFLGYPLYKSSKIRDSEERVREAVRIPSGTHVLFVSGTKDDNIIKEAPKIGTPAAEVQHDKMRGKTGHKLLLGLRDVMHDKDSNADTNVKVVMIEGGKHSVLDVGKKPENIMAARIALRSAIEHFAAIARTSSDDSETETETESSTWRATKVKKTSKSDEG